jgi:outer membrane protein TolC
VAAESEVASREEGVIVAEASLAEAEDAIKRAIFPGHDPEVWALQIAPTDRPTAERVPVNTPAAIQAALENRTDIVAARKNLESATITLSYRRNQTLPSLNLVASYGGAGVGGTQIIREGFGGPIIDEIPGGYGDAAGDVFSFDFPTWTIQMSFSYPIRNRSAQAASARARIARERNLVTIRRLELLIATEVRTAARAVETNFKRVESTRAARVLQERRLDAEEKKFAAGMSTNFLVTQAQRDLAIAEVSELRAIGDYRKSLVDFERVQEAGVSGFGGTGLTVSTSSALGRSDTGSAQYGSPQPF